MVEIEFSMMEGAPGDVNKLLPLLDAFEMQYHIHVNVIGIPWETGWTEIAKFGIYGHGPDVSCLGSTWIGSLAAMQALRPFSAQDVRALGGPETFFEPIWRAGFLPDDAATWAIPWLGDAMIFYYWKAAFEKAGIENPELALSTGPGLTGTLEKLRQSGFAFPLELTTAKGSRILHEAAHWIWSSGGDMISADRRQVVFSQPAAMQGLHEYFSLQPYISPKSLTHGLAAPNTLFSAKEAALSMGGTWLGVLGHQQSPGWNQEVGIQVPEKTYVGGASFVVWRYTHHSQEAFELIRFLSAQPSHIPVSPHSSEVPTKRDALYMPSLESDAVHRGFIQAMQTGRSFPALRLWGSIEDRLISEISGIWADLFAEPGQDLDACLHKHLDPLAQRLNLLLEN